MSKRSSVNGQDILSPKEVEIYDGLYDRSAGQRDDVPGLRPRRPDGRCTEGQVAAQELLIYKKPVIECTVSRIRVGGCGEREP